MIPLANGTFEITPIHEKYAWRICDFVTINTSRLKTYFPRTLTENLTPDLSQLFVDKKIKDFKNKNEFLFVIKNTIDRTVAGLLFVKNLDYTKKEAELAYCIGYQHEGVGITTMAVKEITNWAFEELGLKTLRIIVHRKNPASIRIAEKCGYVWKKTLPMEHQPPEMAPMDMELYIKSNEG